MPANRYLAKAWAPPGDWGPQKFLGPGTFGDTPNETTTKYLTAFSVSNVPAPFQCQVHYVNEEKKHVSEIVTGGGDGAARATLSMGPGAYEVDVECKSLGANGQNINVRLDENPQRAYQ